MDGVAKELEEAARTDGASSLPSLARIVLPLTGPGVAVVVHSTPVIPLYVLISRRLGAGFAPGGAVKG